MLLPDDHHLDPSLYPAKDRKNDQNIVETYTDRFIVCDDIKKQVQAVVKRHNIQCPVSLTVFFDGGQKHKRSKKSKYWPYLASVVADDFPVNYSTHQSNILLLGMSSLKSKSEGGDGNPSRQYMETVYNELINTGYGLKNMVMDYPAACLVMGGY